MLTCFASSLRRTLPAMAAVCVLGTASPSWAELRISNLSVFLNDFDVTVNVVLLGALSETMRESLHSGIATHVRLHVELWQQNRFLADTRLQARTVERQLTYNVLTKEYKVIALSGEQREPYVTKDLREAQRVVSEARVHNLAPATSLSRFELYYVRVRSDVSQNGVNSWISRFAGDAEETPWVQSNLLTLNRSQ